MLNLQPFDFFIIKFKFVALRYQNFKSLNILLQVIHFYPWLVAQAFSCVLFSRSASNHYSDYANNWTTKTRERNSNNFPSFVYKKKVYLGFLIVYHLYNDFPSEIRFPKSEKKMFIVCRAINWPLKHEDTPGARSSRHATAELRMRVKKVSH